MTTVWSLTYETNVQYYLSLFSLTEGTGQSLEQLFVPLGFRPLGKEFCQPSFRVASGAGKQGSDDENGFRGNES